MAIGINRTDKPALGNVKKSQPTSGAAKTGKSASAARGSSSDKLDSISLTSDATQLQALENHINSLPVVDAGIVDAVQLQISTGSYDVNEKSTANKLLTSEEQLSGR